MIADNITYDFYLSIFVLYVPGPGEELKMAYSYGKLLDRVTMSESITVL